MVEFCEQIGKSIQLLYYPPYHSKYNPRHHWVSACDARFASAIAPIFGHHQHLQAASHHHRTLRRKRGRRCFDRDDEIGNAIAAEVVSLQCGTPAAWWRIGRSNRDRYFAGMGCASAALASTSVSRRAFVNSSDIQVDQLFKEFDYEIATLF